MHEPTVDIEVMFTIPRSMIKEDTPDDVLAGLLIEDLEDLFDLEISDGAQVNLVRVSDGLLLTKAVEDD